MSRRCKRFTNYNWTPRSAAVYIARPTFRSPWYLYLLIFIIILVFWEK